MKNIKDVLSWYDLLFLDTTYERWIVYCTGLVDQLSEEEIQHLCVRLHINKRDCKKIAAARTEGLAVQQRLLMKKSFKNSELYHMFNPLPIEVSLYLMAKAQSPAIKKAVSVYFTHLQNTKIHVNGDDLIRLGIQPGRIYTQILNDLHDAVLNEDVAGRKGELEYIRKKYARDVA
jgi:tRNA nucleotidyltransferase (CCA-adding enzyme)